MSNKFLGSIKCCLISLAFFIGFSANGFYENELNYKSEFSFTYFSDTQIAGAHDDDDSSSGDDDSSSADDDSSSADDDSSSADDDSSSNDSCPAGTYPNYSSGDDDSSSSDEDSSSKDDDSSSADDDSSSKDDDSQSSDDDSSSKDDDGSSGDFVCLPKCETDITASITPLITNSEMGASAGSITKYDFVISLNKAPTVCTISMHYESDDGAGTYETATSSASINGNTEYADYADVEGDLLFELNELTKTVTVDVIQDDVLEFQDEAFSVTLSNIANAKFSNDTGVGVITPENP